MQFSLGAEYWFTDAIAARLGYGLVTHPVPGETYGPELPDGRRDLICVGGSYKGGWFQVDLGYMLAMWEGTKDNDVGDSSATGNPNGKANGTYTTTTHLLAFTWAMNF
jgi:long-subunit fatty acid transport protein